MFKEMLESLQTNWLSRISSPLFAALAVSWAAWNYRFLFVLFSDQKIQWRFAYIDSVLYPNLAVSFIYHAALPILTAAFYLYVFPWPSKAVFGYTMTRKVELNNLSKQIEGTRLLTSDEANEIRKQAAEVRDQLAIQEQQFINDRKEILLENKRLLGKVAGLDQELTLARIQAAIVFPNRAKKRTEEYLRSRLFVLTFNKDVDKDRGSKKIMFAESGAITLGQNKNESTWEVTASGELKILNDAGIVHSTFTFDPESGGFDGLVPSENRMQRLNPANDSSP